MLYTKSFLELLHFHSVSIVLVHVVLKYLYLAQFLQNELNICGKCTIMLYFDENVEFNGILKGVVSKLPL